MGVYWITDGDFVKIGRTRNIEKRLSQLQTANARPLSVLAHWRWAGSRTERQLHKIHEHLAVNGEWYELDKTQAKRHADWIGHMLRDDGVRVPAGLSKEHGRMFVAMVRQAVLIEKRYPDYVRKIGMPNFAEDVVAATLQKIQDAREEWFAPWAVEQGFSAVFKMFLIDLVHGKLNLHQPDVTNEAGLLQNLARSIYTAYTNGMHEELESMFPEVCRAYHEYVDWYEQNGANYVSK